MVPNVAHFVFGLAEQEEPFHLLHFLSIESCLRVLRPETIYFHHKHLPWGPYWDEIAPALTLVETDLVDEVAAADYSRGHVPDRYRYAHHADFIRLDALIEHGGVYVDIDTIFVRDVPAELRAAPFVIGREPPVRDEQTGASRPSLCNALLISERGAPFARAWRDQMASELNGTWSNHSGFLAERLSRELPHQVRVEPEATFFPFRADRGGIAAIFDEDHPVPRSTVSVHLWAHLWWDRARQDFTRVHAGWLNPSVIRRAETTFGRLARPYLPARGGAAPGARPASTPPAGRWRYLSLDEPSGYGVAADRCRAALEASGLEVEWTPFVVGGGWGLGYQPPTWLDPIDRPAEAMPAAPVVVAHLVPEYFPLLRGRLPDSFLVGHTVWETDRLPDHWIPCLDSADLLVVPCRLSAEVIASSPVATPVAVVPHVAPTPHPAKNAALEAISAEVFVFYTVADWNERKAPFKTIEAYLRAFSGRDPVLLIVKTSDRDLRVDPPPPGRRVAPGMTAWSLAELLAGHADPPAIRLVTGTMTDRDVGALHRRGDCFVSLCRSEGWGLGAFDAAAYGNPVVTTGFGGHLDYLGGTPYLVDFDLVSVHDPSGFPSYAPDQRWAEPEVDHGAALLRYILAHRKEAAEVAAATAREIAWRYRPAAIATAMRAAVDAHLGAGARDGALAPSRLR
jgi:glycosyltransferase involved in cell wall biosynthesis